MSKIKTSILPILMIVFFGLAVYLNSLGGAFVWDDEDLVKNNLYIKDVASLGKMFSGDISSKETEFAFYRPLQMASYMADHGLWGLDVRGYHFTNMIFHVLSAVSIFWLISLISGDISFAAITALLFVAHPAHTEAVSYISGRSDPMAVLFMLLSFIFYIKGQRAKKDALFVAAIAAYVLSLLSREISVMFLPLIAIYGYAFKEKVNPKFWAPALAVTAAYLILRVTMLKQLLAEGVVHSTFIERLPGFFAALTGYVKVLFFPVGLHMEYGSRLFAYNDPAVVIGMGLLSLLIFALLKYKRTGLVFFALSWTIVTLLPVSNLFPVNAYMAEHWLYMPSIGIFILVAKVFRGSLDKKNIRKTGLTLAGMVIAVLSLLTVKQNGYWRDPVVFYKRTIEYSPESWRLYTDLGYAYSDKGDKEEAVRYYEKALELKKDSAEIYINIGYAYADLGDNKKAIDHYKKALEIEPDNADAYNNIGNAYFRSGEKDKAVEAYEKAIAIRPELVEALFNISVAYFQRGEYGKAVDSCDKAQKLGLKIPGDFLERLKPYRATK